MGVGDIVYNGAGAGGTASGGGLALRISSNTSGTTALVSSGTLTLAGGNNITLSQNGNAITISGANTGIDAQIGGNTTGTTALVSSGTLTLAGGTNVTLSQNGNAITIVGANTGTLQHWWPGAALNQSFSWGNGVAQFFPVTVPNYVTATRAHIAISGSISTSSNSSHAGSLSFQLGIFTNNAGTLSSASSGSASWAWTDTAGASTASLQSNKLLSVPINVNMTPGVYYIGMWSSTSTANANWMTIRNMGAGMINYNGSFASGATGTSAVALGFGHLGASASLVSTVSFQQLSANGAQDALQWALTLMNTSHP
jgi:hypothetical protein